MIYSILLYSCELNEKIKAVLLLIFNSTPSWCLQIKRCFLLCYVQWDQAIFHFQTLEIISMIYSILLYSCELNEKIKAVLLLIFNSTPSWCLQIKRCFLLCYVQWDQGHFNTDIVKYSILFEHYLGNQSCSIEACLWNILQWQTIFSW